MPRAKHPNKEIKKLSSMLKAKVGKFLNQLAVVIVGVI